MNANQRQIKLNKKLLSGSLILTAIILIGLFLPCLPARAEIIQFGVKNIFVDFKGLPFNLNNWAPGMSQTAEMTIENNEDFEINVYFQAEKISGCDILANSLTISAENKSAHLLSLFDDKITLDSINSGQTQEYQLKIDFDKEAENDCQDKNVNFNFVITVEEIGAEGEEEEVIIPGGGGGYSYSAPTAPTSQTGQVTATPEQGGTTTLTNPDGNQIELIIPASALSQPTTFFINQVELSSVNQPDPDSGLFLIAGCLYQITGQQADGNLVTEFSKALTLNFSYTDEQIAGLDEASLKIYYWDGIDWAVIENSQVDVDNNTVTALVDHFTIFALIGTKAEPAEEISIIEKIKEIPEAIAERARRVIEEIIRPAPEAEAEKPAETEGISPEEEAAGEEVPKTSASMLAAIGNILSFGTGSVAIGIIVSLIALAIILLVGRAIRLSRKLKSK